jgi:PAS domain S-box-containing protein
MNFAYRECDIPIGGDRSEAMKAVEALSLPVLMPPAGFLSDCGELGQLIGAFDWAATSVGPIAAWPGYLRTTVATILRSPVPIVTLWHADGVMIYNDAYSGFAAARHPRLLGASVREGWPEVAEFNDTVMKTVLGGSALSFRERELTLFRRGRAEQVWLDLDYSPVLDDRDRPVGVIAIVAEVTEKVLTQRRLHAERRQFGRMFDQSPSFMSLKYGPEHRAEIANPAYYRLVGAREIIGRPLAEAFPELAGQGFQELLDRAYQTGETQYASTVPVRFQREAGAPLDERFIDFVYQPIRDEAGQIIGIFAQGNDVTDRVLAERHAREQEANFQALTQIMPSHLWTARPDGAVDWVNDRATEYFGLPDLRNDGERWLETVHPDDRASSGVAYQTAIRTGTLYEAEFRARRHDGAFRWFLARAVPVRDADGAVVRWVGTNTDIHERKLAEDQNARDRDRFWQLSHDLLVVCDFAGTITAANPAVTRVLGWDDAEFTGASILAFIHPGDLDRSRDQLGRLIEGQPMQGFENRLRAKDGGYRVIAWAGVPEAGVPEAGRIHSVGRDVTEERAARREHERSWTLSPVIKVIATVGGRMLAVNPAWTRLLGWTEAESVGRHVNDFLAPEGLDEGLYGLRQLGLGQTMVEYETLSRTKSGERRRISWTTMPDDGLLYGFGRDVTAERQAAAALAASRAERDRIWTMTNDLMGVAGQDGYLKSVNPAWSRLLGYDEATLLGRPFLQLVAESDRPRVLAGMAKLAQGEGLVEFEDRLVHADGRTSLIAWNAEPLGDTFYVVGRNVTEQRRVEEALRQSQKMEAVGQLTGGIAHDFNNLLQGITGSLDLLERRLAQGRLSDLNRFISAAMSAANRAAALTHRLLAFSRRQPLDPKPVEANPLIASMEDLLRRTIGEHISLDLALSPDLWPTLCDPHQLENAVLNLAINARDAMPDGGTLTIGTSNCALDEASPEWSREMRAGDYVCIGVTDTGIGMSQETIDKAFEPFFTTKPIGQGTGLGLSMIYGFVRQSEGYTKIYSRLGSGTTAKLLLPRCRDEAAAEPTHAAGTAPLPAGGGKTVLITEDEPLVRALIAEVVADLGFAALEASDGPGGLAVLQSRRRIDLLISDVGLPGLNGRQLADAARLLRPGLKVIFLTGYAEAAASARGFLEPGMALITKPFAMADLAAKIRATIEA